MEKLLEIINLQTHFFNGKMFVTPVRNLSLDIYKNEIVGLVGESGCGKSVMAHSILRLYGKRDIVRYEGEVRYKGENILTLPEKNLRELRMKNFGMVFQDAQKSLNPTKKIKNQIVDLIVNINKVSSKDAYDYARELLKSCGLSDVDTRLNSYPHELSGGMKQRIMIAMALSKKPDFLISDEATTALDVTTQAQILKLYQELKENSSTSILFITHDLTILENLCDKLVVMYLGEVVESGSVKDILVTPLHPYTKKLLEAAPKIQANRKSKLSTIDGRVQRLDEDIFACPFYQRCSQRKDICKSRHPDLGEIEKGHSVRCFLYE